MGASFEWCLRASPYNAENSFPRPELKFVLALTTPPDMIASIQKFFEQFIEPGTRQSDTGSEHALQIASAALLLEMMCMDNHLSDEERTAIAATLQLQFGLDASQYQALLTLAEQAAREATDYYQFTSLINKSCDAGQKIRIIENLWHVAMADGVLESNELHLMRKIADLLYVGHADYIAAKQRARASTGLAPVLSLQQ